MLQYPHPSKGELQTGSGSLLKNPEFVIPNEVCEVRNLSFLGILIEEGFIAQKTCDAKSYLASFGMTGKRIFQQPARNPAGRVAQCSGWKPAWQRCGLPGNAPHISLE